VLGAYSDELVWVVGLFVAVVITAALVNRFRPIQRPRLRRLVTVFALFATATFAGIGFDAADLSTWSNTCLIAAQILQAFTLVSLSATLVFAVMLPAVGIELPMIASDLLVGLGYVVVSLAILARHGLNPTSALVSGAVVSAVLAISLQSTLGNIVGGVALQLDGSIREGDWIQLENGRQGRVRSVRWRHTVLETREWSTIIVPNAQLLATSITILGKRDGRNVPQRMVVGFNVDSRIAPSRVVAIVSEALQRSAIENVAGDPAPSVVCTEFPRDANGFATYAARYWIRDVAIDEPTSSLVRARIYTSLQRAQVPLAPHRLATTDAGDEQRASGLEHLDDRLAAVKSVHLFRTLTDDELHTLAAGMSHVVYADGELITRQGTPGHWLYIMTAGTAEIRAHVDAEPGSIQTEQKIRIARITAPDFFGEMSLMTGDPRSADVIALGDVECFRLGKDTFKTILLARPEIATELSAKLAERRVELAARGAEIDGRTRREREASERARILGGIRSFFALSD
jgi:small-conductance mechanosensitive channel/CRP-like cAMP-binding protein